MEMFIIKIEIPETIEFFFLSFQLLYEFLTLKLNQKYFYFLRIACRYGSSKNISLFMNNKHFNLFTQLVVGKT